MDNSLRKESIEKIKEELAKIDENGKKTRTGRFVVSALGSIPWVGGVIAASAALHGNLNKEKLMNYKKFG
ncbi:hypothetical protein [Christiangramia gaetbulicola]|uniref:hypothetical protein n=1 Tax=Christiangramia gaetbulicola TaxID=703340 RepID=UPI001B87840E|nr:hypothetical protein [Christiangramia gaetbulicola]